MPFSASHRSKISFWRRQKQDEIDTTEKPQLRHSFSKIWAPHTRGVVAACALVFIPITLFTIVLLSLVFRYEINEATCPYHEMCPGSNRMNRTTNSHYYIDFPAARLVFIASWSSTISFASVGILMAIYGHLASHQLIHDSGSENSKTLLPSPYQTSLIVRAVNGDFLVLWELFSRKIKSIFWKMEQEPEDQHKYRSRTLRKSVSVFVCCVIASVLIQAADTALHVATESVNLVKIQKRDSSTRYYSRGLTPECLNRETVGSFNNKNFWSCGLRVSSPLISLANATNFFKIAHGQSEKRDHTIFNYTNLDGIQYSVVGPGNVDPDIDWMAESYGVSTKCSAIPAAACNLSAYNSEENLLPFSCHKGPGPIDLEGNFTRHTDQRYYLDPLNGYINEGTPAFRGTSSEVNINTKTVPTIRDEETNDRFPNPWNWVAAIWLAESGEGSQNLPSQFKTSPSVLKPPKGLYYMLLLCNTTVWDVTYSTLNHEVQALTPVKSNGSVAGIAIMPSLPPLNLMVNLLQTVTLQATLESTPESAISTYEFGVSRVLSLLLASQSQSRPALLVQERISKVGTKVPKSLLWMLVTANMGLAFIGVGLTIAALRNTGVDVHQVKVRMGIAGLAAALFEKESAGRRVYDGEKLFEENVEEGEKELKRVGVRRTDAGGVVFTVLEEDQERGQRTAGFETIEGVQTTEEGDPTGEEDTIQGNTTEGDDTEDGGVTEEDAIEEREITEQGDT